MRFQNGLCIHEKFLRLFEYFLSGCESTYVSFIEELAMADNYETGFKLYHLIFIREKVSSECINCVKREEFSHNFSRKNLSSFVFHDVSTKTGNFANRSFRRCFPIARNKQAIVWNLQREKFSSLGHSAKIASI